MKSMLFTCVLALGLAVAQGLPGFSDDPSYFTSFGPSASGFSAPRALTDTGPVTFPPSPIGPDTSGVVVGASGYGFVPPGSGAGIGKGISGGYRGPSPSPFYFF